MQTYSTIELICIWAVPVLLAITVHEASHGYVAKLFGDNTAAQQGRLTLNPINHIDPIGTVIIPIILLLSTSFVFGWAKPVPVVMRNLKNPIRDMAFVAAAGPLSNLLMALGWLMVLKMGVVLAGDQSRYSLYILEIGKAGIIINLLLGILNLIPIPPLDGSRVVASLLPNRLRLLYTRIEPYGFMILLGLMFAGAFKYLIGPPFKYLYNVLIGLV